MGPGPNPLPFIWPRGEAKAGVKELFWGGEIDSSFNLLGLKGNLSTHLKARERDGVA